jgi:uncharacterized protein YecE (DUF72 family)
VNSAAVGRVCVGVSGFSYTGWRGTFYDKDTKTEEFLSFYSRRLNSVEINSSFYAPPRETTVRNWAEKTEEHFIFSFKAPQLITHVLKLGMGSAEAAEGFSRTLELLGSRRGPILFQLPPYLRYDPDRLDEFLRSTSSISEKVFEFRHASWFQDTTYRLLEENETGFCIAETDETEPVFRVTARRAYFRLRKDSYDANSMKRWATKIAGVTEGVPDSYVYLRHDETGENALLARQLAGRLGGQKDD